MGVWNSIELRRTVSPGARQAQSHTGSEAQRHRGTEAQVHLLLTSQRI